VRRFVLDRVRDETGISGTGVVAEGVLFSTGWVALTGHNGATLLRWLDEAAP
jgi:hypothetical protein